jgi:MFS family permease
MMPPSGTSTVAGGHVVDLFVHVGAAPSAAQGLYDVAVAGKASNGALVERATRVVRYGQPLALAYATNFFDDTIQAVDPQTMAFGAPMGSAIGAFTADFWGRRPTIVMASVLTILLGSFYPFIARPGVLMVVGFFLIVPIYVLVALLFAIYIPELFPTEVRLRAAGICNTFGRGAIIFTPFIVVALFRSHGVGGVLAFMNALLIVQIIVVLTLGVEPKKRRLEEIEPEESVSPYRAEVRNP